MRTTGEKHPKGLYVLFATEMWERFGFYTMLAMLVLYMRDAGQGFGWTTAKATGIYSWYQAFVYATPLIGGWLADRYLGYRNAITIGGIFFMAGYFMLAVPQNIPFFYLALVLLVLGNGFFKPNVSSMVGNLYREGSHLKDRAYLIFYMGINIGAFIAPLIAEYVKKNAGFNPAFAVAGVGMIICLTISGHSESTRRPPTATELSSIRLTQTSRQRPPQSRPIFRRTPATTRSRQSRNGSGSRPSLSFSLSSSCSG